MKFEVMRDSLLEGLSDVIKAVSSKTTIPILTGLKLEITNKGLYITGSDSDITIQTFIPVEKMENKLLVLQNLALSSYKQEYSMKLYGSCLPIM